uniref:Uncharacterized protein n=1 Tax=Strongyloides stercoralis TaxID=6248 RepID=A0A0K0E5Z0_STRER
MKTRVKMLNKIGMSKSVVPQMDKEFKDFIKQDKTTIAREEKLDVLTTLLTLTDYLLLKIDPCMTNRKKQIKTKDEIREFKVEWTENFSFIRNSNGLPMCLICLKNDT